MEYYEFTGKERFTFVPPYNFRDFVRERLHNKTVDLHFDESDGVYKPLEEFNKTNQLTIIKINHGLLI